MNQAILTLPASSKRAWRRFVPQRWTVRLACIIVLMLIVLALIGPWLVPHAPNEIALAKRLQSPDALHWLGTDHLGRDIFSRLIIGVRVSLGTVAISLGLIVALGVVIGGASGFIGGRTDQVIMRVTDIFLTFPTLVLALFLIGMLGTGLMNVILAIALSHWAWYARIVRGIVMSLRHREFLLAAQLSGASRMRTFVEHLLPATFAQLVVLATLDLGHIMMHVAGLSFLGLGVTPPTAEWGVMISDARQFVWTSPMLILWPGLALFISVMAFNILGDAMRDKLDPHLQAEHGH